jgi:hypothetical protein
MSITIEEALLSEATFQLLASSTLRRYLRVAREYAGKAGLERRAALEAAFAEAGVERARQLYEAVRGAERRPAEEAELALLLVTLSDARAPVDDLLLRLSEDRSPGLGWLRSLAERLRKAGPLLQQDEAKIRRLFMFLGGPPPRGEEYEPRADKELMQGSHETPRDAA